MSRCIAPAICALGLWSCSLPPAGQSHGEGDFVTTVYMSEEEGLRTVLEGSTRRASEQVVLTTEARHSVESLLGGRIPERELTVYAGVKSDGSLDGFAVIHEEIGKFKPFRFVVGIEPDGSVRRVALLVYRESRGGEIGQRRFHGQYVGKKASDPIRVNHDILNVSGATMSVTSMNLGVKKVLAVVQTTYVDHPERTARLVSNAQPLSDAVVVSSAQRELCEAREARYLMGSLCEIRAFGSDPRALRQSTFRAFAAMEAADRLLSDYRPQSELSEITRCAGGAPVEISRLTSSFLRLALNIARESEGACDITVGPLCRAWGGRGDVPRVPSAEAIARIKNLVDWRAIEIAGNDGEGWSARLARPGMILDPGAVGKGFAVDLAVEMLREGGVSAALVDFSGNMYALGAPPGEPGWAVAVCDPAQPGELLGVLNLRDQAISSSGGYERQGNVSGRAVCHIVSPRTLKPIEGVLGTTVVAPSAGLADGYSTAAFVLGQEAIGFLAKESGVQGLVAFSGENGKAYVKQTPGWRLE